MNRPLPSSSINTLSAQSSTHRKSKSPTTTTTTPTNGTTTTGGVPTKHPSRVGAPKPSRNANTSSGPAWGVQWSTLQGLASSVLGGDVLGNDSEQVLKQRRKPIDSGGGAQHSSSSSSWIREGTEVHSDHGSMRPRGRRRDAPDSSRLPSTRKNNHKRATSPDPEESIEVGDMEGEKDILVYVHHVKPTDTVEGVVIAFNISPGTLRKANGMWSHDSIQSRRTLLLPIDECQAKGKPIDLLATSNEPTNPEPETETEEKPYKHESYVTIDGIGQVEIARLARKKLSHFPPRRRKPTTAKQPSFGELPATPSLLDEPPLLDLLGEPSSPTNVFRGMTPGVGELHPQSISNSHGPLRSVKVGPGVAAGPEAFTLKSLGELATDTATGLENIGGVVEGFVRRWTAKAQGFVGGDLIELTQRLGFELDDEDESQRGGEAMGRGGSSGSSSSRRGVGTERAGSGSGRDGGRRVVRERLTRGEAEEGTVRDKVL